MQKFLRGESFRVPTGFSKIAVGYTANWCMSACSRRAFPNQDNCVIGIDGGAWLQLFMAFQRLLRYSNTLPGHFEKSCPPLTDKLNLPRLDSLEGARGIFDGTIEGPKLPDDRQGTLRQLIFYGMLAIFFHELVHIIDGHLDFRQRARTAKDHLTLEQWYELRARETIALEHLADMRSAVFVPFFISVPIQIRTGAEAPPPEGIIRQLELWGFALAVVFLITEHFQEFDSTVHPPAAHRKLIARVGPYGYAHAFGHTST